ncbi:MAG: dockerin type I repeat-containing protein [Myxococcales bacterium]|nr:dockerin type I repeat-containing protein [Myxococcales bacterium]
MMKRFSILALGSLFFAAPSFAQTCPSDCSDIVWGDVNGDGAIDITDLSVLASHLAGTGTVVPCDGADNNRDGAIDIADLNNLGAYLAGTGPAPQEQFCCDDCANTTAAGDANEDGTVDIADSTAISDYLAGTNTDICLHAADANADGVVDEADVKVVLAYLFDGGDAPALECF